MSNQVTKAATLVAERVREVFGVRGDNEEPAWESVGAIGEIELRRYPRRMAAQTVIVAAPGEAREQAFERLAGYIFGGNAQDARIAMTVPVAQAPAHAAAWPADPAAPAAQCVRFYLPAALASPPSPRDPQVEIAPVESETVAVLRFTGSTGDQAVAEARQRLLAALEGTAWRAAGVPMAWFYDPPWTLPPLRRNEMAVRVSQPD